MSWRKWADEEPGSVHFCTWAVDSEGRCLRASCIADRLRAELAEQYTRHVVVVMSRDKAEAAIAGVRERCDYLAGHIAEIILRALDGGTE